MSTANNGGSAFPQNTVYIAPNGAIQQQGPQGGMTLRDYFAAKAMQVFIAELDGDKDDNPGSPSFTSLEVAALAYEQADAMLEARNK